MIGQTCTNEIKHEYSSTVSMFKGISSMKHCFAFNFAQLKRSWRRVRSKICSTKHCKMFRIGPFLLIVTSVANWVWDARGLAVPKIQYQHAVSS